MIGVIVAGGMQTRMKGINNDLPKCLYEFNGKSNLLRNVDLLMKRCHEVYIIVSKENGEQIYKEFVGYRGLKPHIIVDWERLGSGGCLSLLPYETKQDQYLVVLGDIYLSDIPIMGSWNGNLPVVYVQESEDIKDSDFRFGRADAPAKTPIGVFLLPTTIELPCEYADLMRDLISKVKYEIWPTGVFAQDYGTPERYELLKQTLSK